MKQKKKLFFAIVLVVSIVAMVLFILFRYSSTTSPLFPTSQNVQPIDTSQNSSFFRTIDEEGNHIVEITADIIDIQQRVSTGSEELESFLVLESQDVSETFEIGLGPDKQHFFFRDQKLLAQTNEDNVTTGETLPVNEIRSKLAVGESVKIQLRLIPDLRHYVDAWQEFFMSKSNDAPSINYHFVLNVALLP